MSYVVDTGLSATVATAHLGYYQYPNAITSWSATFGSYTALGSGGYVTVCDSGTSADCTFAPNYFPDSQELVTQELVHTMGCGLLADQ